MNRLARLPQFLTQDLWTIDPSGLSRPSRIGIHALRLAIAVGMEFRHRLLDARAAGLVFTTLLSLVSFSWLLGCQRGRDESVAWSRRL